MNYIAKIKGFDNFNSVKETSDFKLVDDSDGQYIIQMEGVNYKAILLALDYDSKSFRFNINGRIIEIELSDDFDKLIDQMEFNKGDKLTSKELHAPMPGLILSIDVKEGQHVLEGDKLFTLEAMKMENIIKSSIEGIVKSVCVETNNTVEKGSLLLAYE